MASLLNNLKGYSAGTLAPNFAAFRDKVEEFVADVQEELGVLDELRYEWRRLQTFTDWPLDAPRPAELAKAGFYFTPAKDAADRCAHFAADKFFSSWEPQDDPWEVLKDNCPESAFVLGASNNVPLPSAYEKQEGHDAEPGAGARPAAPTTRSLSSYLSSAVQRVAAVAAAMPQPPQASAAAGGAESAPAAQAAAGAAGGSGGVEVMSKGKRKGKKSRGGGAGTIFEAGGGEGEGFPSALAGEGSESGSCTTPRTPRAPAGSKEELAAIAGLVGSAVSAMQQRWDERMRVADEKITHLKGSVGRLGPKVEKLSGGGWLAPARAALAAIGEEKRTEEEALSTLRAERDAIKAEVAENSGELAKLKDAEKLADEWDRKCRSAAEEVEELEDAKSRLEGEISELQDEKQHLRDEAEDERSRVREGIATLHASRKEAEGEAEGVQEDIERRRRELASHEGRLSGIGAAEQKMVALQAELEEQQRQVKAKEEEVRGREEWLLKKEGEQRAQGNRR